MDSMLNWPRLNCQKEKGNKVIREVEKKGNPYLAKRASQPVIASRTPAKRLKFFVRTNTKNRLSVDIYSKLQPRLSYAGQP